MKRRLAAILCALLLAVSALPAASALEGEDLRAADTLATLGLIDGTYDLTAPATRAQAAARGLGRRGRRRPPRTPGSPASGTCPPPSPTRWTTPPTRAGSPASPRWSSGPVSPSPPTPGPPSCCGCWAGPTGTGTSRCPTPPPLPSGWGLFSAAYSGVLTQGDLFETAADALSFSFRDGSGTVARRLVDRGAVSRAAANALGLLTPVLTPPGRRQTAAPPP